MGTPLRQDAAVPGIWTRFGGAVINLKGLSMKISVDAATRLCHTVFAEMDTPEHILAVTTEALIEADLRGIASHGIRLLPLYLDLKAGERIVPEVEPEVVFDTPTTTVFDARMGMGHYASMVATERVIDRAQSHGMAAAVVRCNNHNGAISHFAIRAARSDLIGLAATSCAPRVTPYGGKTGVHGTNPIAYAVPVGQADPLVFDFSTGYSGAKLKAEADRLGYLPEGYVLSAAGQPSTDPEDLFNGLILPVAGPIGYGLGLLVDALCGGLADSPIGQQVPPVTVRTGPYHGTFFVMALAPAAFGGSEAFAHRLEALVEQIDACEPLDSDQPVRWPGQRGWELRRQRLADGIPIDDADWERLLADLKDRDVSPQL